MEIYNSKRGVNQLQCWTVVLVAYSFCWNVAIDDQTKVAPIEFPLEFLQQKWMEKKRED